MQIKVRPSVPFQVIQVYVSWLNARIPSLPRLQLVDFRRVHIPVNKTVTEQFVIERHKFMVWVDKHTGYAALPSRCYCASSDSFKFCFCIKLIHKYTMYP